jgi:hypothetical protein
MNKERLFFGRGREARNNPPHCGMTCVFIFERVTDLKKLGFHKDAFEAEL